MVSSLTSKEKIRSFLPLVDFIAEVSGPFTEVVLHDVTSREHALIAIRNGRLSGRDVGAPMTDFAVHLLEHARKEGKHFITNYLGQAGGGDGKFLKSSTFFIRDDEGEIIGILGINTDLSALRELHKMLGQMIALDDEAVADIAAAEARMEEPTVRDMVRLVMDQVMNTNGSLPAEMSTEEKKKTVEELDRRGVFLLKGTVSEVAQRMDVSEQTIYRYLK